MKEQPLAYWSLLRLSAALGKGEISSVEVTRALLERIAKLDGGCRSYATLMADRALAQADRADKEIARGFSRGPLHGVPVAVKDLCFTRDAPTSAGMAIHRDWVPDYDATVVARLNAAGAIILGKLHMTEGAGGTHHPSMPPPRNPWNSAYWPGASSSGSGVATAAGLCYGSLGSDTGGSIRFPSACCGITGIKPTWGRVSRHGIFPLAESLDHIGPMARSAADAAAILGVIAGEDPADPTSLDAPVPDYLAALGGGIRGLRIGIDRAYSGDGVDEEIVRSLAEAERVLVSLGGQVRDIRFPPLEPAVGTSMATLGVEVADAHRDSYPARSAEYGPKLAALIESGHKVSALDLARAQRERRHFCGMVSRLWSDIDLLLIPALVTAVPLAEEMEAFSMDPAVMARLVRFTVPFDLTGSPTISLPCGFSKSGLPLGLQLVGPPLSEPLLCRAGHAFQQATDWHTRRPDLG
jgi:amidase